MNNLSKKLVVVVGRVHTTHSHTLVTYQRAEKVKYMKLKKPILLNFSVRQYKGQSRLNQAKEIGNIKREKLVYRFEYDSTMNSQLLVINELPSAFMDRYNFRNLPLRFLVRDCYKDLYKIVEGIMEEDLGKGPAVLFTGVPGIGKSIFLMYFICRFLSESTSRDEKRFAFEIKSDLYHYFSPTCIDNEFQCFANLKFSYVESAFPLRDILVVSDLEATELPGIPRGKWKFIFSSPDPARYKEYLKNKPSYSFFLPTWKKEELQKFNPNESDWINLFNVYGGVPRYVFSNEKFRLKPMDEALLVKGLTTAQNFFRLGSYSSIDSDMSYCLVHINPKPVDVDDGQDVEYEEAVYSLASDYVFNELAKRNKQIFITTARNLFNYDGNLASKTYGDYTAGLYFAKLCLWLDPIAETTFTATSLSEENATLQLTLPPMEVLGSDWKSCNNLSVNVLYQPTVRNLESGDAFCVIEKDDQTLLVVFQLTVSEKHPVEMNGLNAIIKAYPANLKFDSKILLFVTHMCGKIRRVQSIVTQNYTGLKNSKASNNEFQQYLYKREFKLAN